MARLSVVQCDRCFVRQETSPQNLPEGWCVAMVGYKSVILCGDCSKAFEQFMGEIEKAAKPEEPGSKVE